MIFPQKVQVWVQSIGMGIIFIPHMEEKFKWPYGILSLYDQMCKLLSHPVFQMGMKKDRKGNRASGKRGHMKWIRVWVKWQNRLELGKVERALCLLHKAVGVVTELGKGGRNANHAVSILVFSHRPTQNPRSEHTVKVKIWITSDFLKLVNGVWTVCIEDGDLRPCYSLCWGGPGFLLLGLTQAVAFYWAPVITRDEIAEILENGNKIYLGYTKISLWSGSLTTFSNQLPWYLRKEPRGAVQTRVCHNKWKKKITEALA